MLLDNEIDNICVVYRGGAYSFYYLLILLPIILIICSGNVDASTEFIVHRMAQFDVNGFNYGSRLSSLSLEAKTLRTWKSTRHCVVVRLEDLKISDFKNIRQNAGGLIIQLPKNFSDLTMHHKKHICSLEQEMLMYSTPIPVYFSNYNEKLDHIIMDITHQSMAQNNSMNKGNRGTAFNALLRYISSNGYQVVIVGGSHAMDTKFKLPIIQGELKPYKYVALGNSLDSNKLPTIIITSTLKTFGLYNDYPLNVDTAALLSLVDIFSKYYNSPNISPKYHIIFLITESGSLLNYQGTKKWLDDNQLQNIEFILCLDTIMHPFIENTMNKKLYLHVSKPPKEHSPLHNFVKYLRVVAAKLHNVTIEGIHKKINLAEKHLLWEHEHFCMKRLTAFTLSSLASPKDPRRHTIFKEEEVFKYAKIYFEIIAEALLYYIYRNPTLQISVNDTYKILTNEHINCSLLQIYENAKSAIHNNDLQNAFKKYLYNVKLSYDKPDVRDPDFMLYEGHDALLHFYSIKPAIFDLFLSIVISVHSLIVYMIVKYFPLFYQTVCSVLPDSVSDNAATYSNVRYKFKSI